MAKPNKEEIERFLHTQGQLWIDGDRENWVKLYKEFAPKALTIEYVGSPVGDGWQTLYHMWDTYNAKVGLEIENMLINGNEAACKHLNIRKDGSGINPTIEIYRFEDGELHIRYFYKTFGE